MTKPLNSTEVLAMVEAFILPTHPNAEISVKPGRGEFAITASVEGHKTVRGNKTVGSFHLLYEDAIPETITQYMKAYFRFYYPC